MDKSGKNLRVLAITLGIMASVYCFLFVSSFAGLNLGITAHAGTNDTDLNDTIDDIDNEEDDYEWPGDILAKRKTIVINKQFVHDYDTYIGTRSRKGVFCALMWALSEDSQATEIKVLKSDYPVIKDTDGRKRRLCIYSNKHLDLGGATIQRSSTENVIVTGDPDAKSNAKEYKYKNISISNGTINGGKKTQGMTRFARVDGLTLNNITFTSIGKHAAELAAVKNVKITNCTFENPNYKVKSIKSGYESLSFDMTSYDKDFVKYAPADYMTCKDVLIENCTFKGVYRGLGSHHYKNKVFYDKITVTGCKFINIYDTAIECAGWTNAKITNNTMKNVGFGIDFRQPVSSMKKSKKYSSYSSNTLIEGNKIKVKNTGNKMHMGIRVGGFNLEKKSNGIKAGDYYVNNFTVKNNTVSGKCMFGISVEYSKKSTIKGNKISGYKSLPIQYLNCSKIKESGNTGDKK